MIRALHRVRVIASWAYFRSRLVRELVALARWPWIRRGAPDLAHLATYGEWAHGPIQRDEALLLHALIRDLRPATVVEIGFLFGHSAFNFLRALDDDARIYSFDIDAACVPHAHRRCRHDPRFVLRSRAQDQIRAEDVNGGPIDFVFIDGAHDLAINKRTFERLVPLLSPRALIAVHDTGGIPRTITPPGHPTLEMTNRWASDEFEHQPDERAFVNWLLVTHQEFSQIHLHSTRAFRHGITLLQRSMPLARPRQRGAEQCVHGARERLDQARPATGT
jgi:predicted O-methyltransferase YrrM